MAEGLSPRGHGSRGRAPQVRPQPSLPIALPAVQALTERQFRPFRPLIRPPALSIPDGSRRLAERRGCLSAQNAMTGLSPSRRV